jgi:hypothetical protein
MGFFQRTLHFPIEIEAMLCPNCGYKGQRLAPLSHGMNHSVPRKLRFGKKSGEVSYTLESALHSCPNCSVVYLWPQPEESVLKSHYQASSLFHNTHDENSFLASINSDKNAIFVKTLMDGIAQLGVTIDSSDRSRYIADIGSNAAGILNAFRLLGFNNLLSVEPDSVVQERNRQYVGCETHVGFLENIPEKYFGACSLVLLADSLEHHIDPRSSVNICYELLGHEGCLFIKVPNIQSIMAIHNIEAWNWFEPDHLFYFSKQSISMLLRDAGFTRLHITTPIDAGDIQDLAAIIGQDSINPSILANVEANCSGRSLFVVASK